MRYNNYPKGSEWRKWDLHAHTPLDHEWNLKPDLSTIEKKKEFAKKYVEFAKEQNLSVIAITDHNFCNELDDLLIPYIVAEGKLNGITILPGVEISASDGSGIHLLVIFHENSDLRLIKKVVESFFNPGTELMPRNGQVPVSAKGIEEIHDIIENTGLEHIIIFAHADRENGVLNPKTITGQRRIEEWHKDYIKICQISKAPSEINENTFLHNVINGTDVNYRKDIRYILASDCRSIEKNNNEEGRNYLGQKFVWIKADPNFNGLKQILYEADRVYIGENAPEKLPSAKIITSVEIKKNNSWFIDSTDKYIFNEGQVSIIGGKGAGKTALLDLIAYACQSLDVTDTKSFLYRAAKELEGIEVTVNWKDGDSLGNIISKKLKPALSPEKQPILYLSQSFVEGLVEPDKILALTNQIEKVIFQNIEDETRSGFIGFSELKTAHTSTISANKKRILDKIKEINKEIALGKIKIATKEILGIEEKTKEKELTDIKNSIDSLKKGETETDSKKIEELATLSKEKNNIEKRLADKNRLVLLKKEVINDIDLFKDDAEIFIRKTKAKLKKLNFDDSYIQSLNFELLPMDLIDKLSSNTVGIIKDDAQDKDRLKVLKENIKSIEDNLKTEESRINKIRELNTEFEKILTKLSVIKAEIKSINEHIHEQKSLAETRGFLILDYFTFLFAEKGVLEKLYSPLVKKLEESEEENTGLFEFEVSLKVLNDSISDRIQELLDRNKSGNYHKKQSGDLAEDLQGISLELNFYDIKDTKDFINKNSKAIVSYFSTIEKLFINGIEGAIFSIQDQLKTKYSSSGEEEFYNWLYDLSNYKVDYTIKFNSTSLEKLSPGLKGLALLILFLELDKEDRRPLLIDQPEENLDNRSVYETLCKYFVRAKKRRQIFLVTHNPNLVVNTDSEQVFVSNFTKDRKQQPVNIYHVSGGLENSRIKSEDEYTLHKLGIKQHICHVLEGGQDAFKARERKYEIQ